MKDYGIQESWTKDFVIKNLQLHPPSLESYRLYYEPVMFLSDGSILISYCNEVFISYNQEMDSYLKIEGYSGTIIAYHPSFVSLCTFSNGAKVERIRDSKMYDKLCAEFYDDYAGYEVVPPQDSEKRNTCSDQSALVEGLSKATKSSLDSPWRIGTQCARCDGNLGYVFRGKGFAVCENCFDKGFF
ncbi:uncharacterized protein LOC121050065 [Rosa chinensis]|uniref:uncharacterized protein LOC121050065 n=1 Tax=Rosa chinensis TaxID=74649 RepID=UPI001AD8C728|nr:uncharacterized protein LOC121050065 [Rosa chinensis]